MNLRAAVAQYIVAAVLFLAIDLIWLTMVAPSLYDRLLGDLLADPPVVWAAALFYALFVAGLVHFVVGPALQAGSWRRAAGEGAAFGLVTYGTWDLTSMAVIEGFPAALVPIDMAWGAVLAASVGTGTYLVWQRIGDRVSGPSRP